MIFKCGMEKPSKMWKKRIFLEELRPLDREEKSEMLSMENRMNMQDLKSKLARVARLEEINWW